MTGEGRRQERRLDEPPVDGDFWPAPDPLNRRRPPSGVSPRPQGDVPVIARLVWLGGAELVPARAIRWTHDHVLVMAKPPYAPSNARELLCWLRVEDVYRTMPRRARPGRT